MFFSTFKALTPLPPPPLAWSLECRLMWRELQSVAFPCFTLCLMWTLQFISLFLAFDGSSFSQSHKIVQSLIESEDLMREAVKHTGPRQPISSRSTTLWKCTQVSGNCSSWRWKSTVHHQQEKEKHVRDLSWPVNEVCEEWPALGMCNQDGLWLISSRANY